MTTVNINPDDFVFHPSLFPMAVAMQAPASATSSASLPVGTTFAYGDWVETMKGTLAPQFNITIDDYVYQDWVQEYTPVPGNYNIEYNFYGQMDSDNRVRLVIQQFNYTNATVAVTPVTFNAVFNMYHIASTV